MSDFASTWPNATVDPDGNTESNDPPEPGDYEVSVQDAKAFTSKAGNEVMIVELRVLSGPKEGYVWPDVRGFKSDGQTKAAKSMCARLGITVDAVASLEELDRALKGVVGSYFKVAVVQNGEWRNTYVNERLNGSVPQSDVPSDGVPTHAVDTDGDDIPFAFEVVPDWAALKASAWSRFA